MMARAAVHNANAGDPLGDKESQDLLLLKITRAGVNVHVPETGNQELAGSIKRLRASECFNSVAAAHGDNASAANYDRHVMFDWRALRIDDRDVSDRDRFVRPGPRLLRGETLSQTADQEK